jgi:hypothetical protein
VQTKFYVPGESMTAQKNKNKNAETVNFIEYNQIDNEPATYAEALNGPLSEKWFEAIESELQSLEENETWTITELPEGKNTIKTKWIFKIKRDNKNNPERFKARLVAKGYGQEKGIDYNETFAPVIKQQSLRLLISIAVNENFHIHHVDISTAFLNGLIEEKVYIDPPEGLHNKLNQNQVLKLNKALYGLKQASRSWNKMLVNFLTELGFMQLTSDTCIFYNGFIIIAIYVDDIIIMGRDKVMIIDFKNRISHKFKTKDLGDLKYILGITIERYQDKILLNQKNYIERIIERFKSLKDSKDLEIPIQPNHKLTSDLKDETETLRNFIDPTIYRQAIGSLIYLMTCTRPDISYSVSTLSKFMQEPRELHWRFLKRLLRYLKTTSDYSLVYRRSSPQETHLIGYTDSDYAGSIEDRKSTSGYAFKYGNCLISWNSSKQKTVSLSSTEAEYIGLTNSIKEIIWLKQILCELKRKFRDKTQLKIFCDNKSAICLSKNPEFHSRTKHIDNRHHFIRNAIQDHGIDIIHISTEDMPADIFTKALPKIKHKKCIELLGMNF